MATLAEIIAKARQTAGNLADRAGTVWGRGEGSLSEYIAGGPTTNTGYDAKLQGPSYYAPVSAQPKYTGTNTGYSPELKSALMTPRVSSTTVPQTYSTTGDTGTTPTGGDGTSSAEDLAAEQNRIATERAIQRLDAIKEFANRLRGNASGAYDRVTGELNTNYDKLKEFGKEKLGQAMEGFDQAGNTVQNTYGRIIGNAQRAMESGIMKNRVLARAMGLGGSSNYLWSQGDTRNAGMNATNDANFEKGGKLNALGTQKATTKTDFAANELALDAERVQLLGKAQDTREKAYADADIMEKQYAIDGDYARQEADAKYVADIEAIKNYRLENPDTSGNTAVGNFSKTYNAMAPIQSTLDNTSGMDSANANITKMAAISPYGTGAINAGGGGGMSDASALMNIKKKVAPKEDPYGYFQNLA